MRTPKPFALSLLILLAAGAGLALAQRQPAARQPGSVVWKPVIAGTEADYAGIQACQICHPMEAQQFLKTSHATAPPADQQYATGCEACHGPGRAHVDAMEAWGGDEEGLELAKRLVFAFDASARDNSDRCLACHASSQEQALFAHSEHQLNGLACQSCHVTHPTSETDPRAPASAQSRFFAAPRLPEEDRWLRNSLLRDSEPALCFSCHSVVEAQFALPSHHRVPEGLMKCTDCHNPHGTRNQPMLRQTNWEACVDCHIEKRGPFVFEHASVKIEGCTACHTPHGSVNRMLLLRREGRFLCLQCHVDPHAANVPHGRLGFQTRGECVRCHVAVHGSNFSEALLH